MIKKLLIANRGEIACRIIRAAQKRGVRTVAVYSDADASAMHTAMADEAVHIGAAAPADSYLRGDVVIDAALRTGADAIHPGYGFLSENAGFADAVAAAGLIFVGPPPDAIRAMGLKDAAKQRVRAAGAPVVPGYDGPDQSPDVLAAEADKIGYPVLIKARAGGGGKGMRKVDQPADFSAALQAARREAEAAFGDGACLIEKWITSPRHIEIQVFGDMHGNVVHLFERDCSLQRRHQKVIEEAPAPGMTAEMRAAMGAAAVKIAQSVGYYGAGTVEFIVDGSDGLRPDRFWFMEMNTRLQVEHPVTEAVTGVDLVDWQLRVAAGEPLPKTQSDLSLSGWAFEARLYAEDPATGFLPSIGRLTRLRFPQNARIDSGVRENDDISTWYDPMIAKIITHGPDRAAGLARLRAALTETQVAGLATNRDFLIALCDHDGFSSGAVDTGLIDRYGADLTAIPEPCAIDWTLAAMGVAGLLNPPVSADPWRARRGFALWSPLRHGVRLGYGDDTALISLIISGERAVQAHTPAGPVDLVASGPPDAMRVATDGRALNAAVAVESGAVTVFYDARARRFTTPDPFDITAEISAEDVIRAPMPGLVAAVFARPGDAVRKGDPVLTLEAMKMAHVLTAPRDGVVADVRAAAGDQVAAGDVLAALEEAL